MYMLTAPIEPQNLHEKICYKHSCEIMDGDNSIGEKGGNLCTLKTIVLAHGSNDSSVKALEVKGA